MEDLSNKWNQIISKVESLIQENVRLKSDNLRLTKSYEKLQEENDKLEEEKRELLENFNKIKLVKGSAISEEERAEMKTRMKHFMEEIDNCLAKINA
ncbi:MAG: hypothetical protein M9887_00435 [Chitinophagales bacterium]|nr:hypothetical protein [Chitinophagales bacterium]